MSGNVIIANNRVRGLASEWVSGDPRRDGRVGVTYAVDPVLTSPNHIPEAGVPTRPLTRNRDGTNRRSVSNAELDVLIEEGMTALNVVDFYSIIAHETGHSLSLAHFGKVFVTRKAAADGIQIPDIKYPPRHS